MASTRRSAINAATRGWSPTSPMTSDAPCATAQSKPVARHHDALAGIDERMNHVASDIAGTTGDQDRHAVNLLSTAIVPAFAVKTSSDRTYDARRVWREFSRHVVGWSMNRLPGN